MRDVGEEISLLICNGETVINYKRWLADEVNHLAAKIPGLDAFPTAAILPLSRLAAHGESRAEWLTASTGIEQPKLGEYLESLCEFKFIEETANGYRATASGVKAFKAIGYQMVLRERFELKRQLGLLDGLYEQLPSFNLP